MLLYLSLFTVLLSCVLVLFNKKSNPNAIYLALFFVLSSTFGIAHHFVFQTQEVFWMAVFFNHFVPLMFLIGPALYFYVRGTLNEAKRLSRKDAVHLIPALFSFIGTIPYYYTAFDTKLTIAKQLTAQVNSIRSIDVNLFYDAGESFVLRSVLCLGYVLFSGYRIIYYYRFTITKNGTANPQQTLVLRWLIVLISATLIITSLFLYMAFEAAFVKISETITNGYAFYLATGMLYFLMTLSLLQFPSVLYGIPVEELKETEIEKQQLDKIPNKASKAEKRTKTIDTESIAFICSSIETYLAKEKPYLDPQFSVFTIAAALGMAETQVNYAIKNGLQTSFVKLRSELRVAHALNLLQSTTKERLTIEAIGEQSGFKTRSNFYMAFKERVGVTPTEFIAAKTA